MNRLHHLWACVGLLLGSAAFAQGKPLTAAEPLVQPPSAANDGTTIVGDRESPIGLYITPWRNAAPQAELDRPARFLEEALTPLDAEVFRRQVEYYNTISEHLRVRTANGAAATR